MFRPLSGNIERKFPITLNVPSNKILDRQALQRRVAEWRHQGQTVVLANGCFDLLHVGHIRYLKAAKALGGRLVVAVNSDASARSLKGEGRPLMPEQERAEIIAALEIADAEQAEVMRRHQAEVQEVSQGPERLLIVRLGSMGDVIHALPAATLLRRAFPPATLGWMIEERWVELLCAPATPRLGPRNAGRPLVDAVHPVNTLGWRSAPFSGSTWKDVAGAWREVRAARYELAVDFQGAVRTSLMARWTGAEACIGFEHPREHAASLFYTHTVETQERHVIEQNAALAAAVAGVPAEVPAVEFPVDPAAEDSCERRLRLHAVRQFAILNPGAGWEGKQWPPERYGEVARGLAGLGLRCLINFGPGEEALARAAAAASAGAAEAVP